MSTLNEAVRDLRGLIHPVEGEDEFICESATTLIDLIPEDAVIVVVRRGDLEIGPGTGWSGETGGWLQLKMPALQRITLEAADALGVLA